MNDSFPAVRPAAQSITDPLTAVVNSSRELAGGTAGLLAIFMLLVILLVTLWTLRRLMPYWINLLVARESESKAVRDNQPKFATALETLADRLPQKLEDIHDEVKSVAKELNARSRL